MLWVGPAPAAASPARCTCWSPPAWLAVELVFLIGFRIGLNVTNSNVIDVGYAGVIGADRLTHGDRLYGDVPQGQRARRHLRAGQLRRLRPVRAGAALERDVGRPARRARRRDRSSTSCACALLFLIGRRVRGPTLGIALAYAWAAYPFTLLRAEHELQRRARGGARARGGRAAGAQRAPARGVFAALAGMTKFAPLALAPVLATHPPRGGGVPLRARLAAALIACAPRRAAATARPAARSGTARSASRPRAARRSRSGALDGWAHRRSTLVAGASPRSSRSRWRSSRAGATSSAWPRCAPRS